MRERSRTQHPLSERRERERDIQREEKEREEREREESKREERREERERDLLTVQPVQLTEQCGACSNFCRGRKHDTQMVC